jgi:hypothetical protein
MTTKASFTQFTLPKQHHRMASIEIEEVEEFVPCKLPLRTPPSAAPGEQ